MFGDGSKTIKLEDGLNKVEIEVVSEDGTTKMYSIAVTKLSASAAQLSDLTVQGGHSLQPDFSPTTYDYSCELFQDLHSENRCSYGCSVYSGHSVSVI